MTALPPASSPTTLTDEALRQEFDRARGIVQQGMQPAYDRYRGGSGKPLLILMSEVHVSPRSAVMELAIYEQAQRLGIMDVAVELPREGRIHNGQRYPGGEEMMQRATISRWNLSNGADIVHAYARFSGAEVHYLDDGAWDVMDRVRRGESGAVEATLHPRNDAMIRHLIGLNRPMVMVTGGLHVDDLANNPALNQHYEIVRFNVNNSQFFTNLQERVRAAMPQRAPVRGRNTEVNVSSAVMGIDENRLIAHAIGNPEIALSFIRWAERNGQKDSLIDNQQQFARALSAFSANPNLLQNSLAVGRELYDLGADETSGRIIGRGIGRCVQAA